MSRKAMTREELKAALGEAGLDTRGLKADLLERWESHLQTLQQEEETNSEGIAVPPTRLENSGKDDVEQMNYAALRTALKDLGFATTGNTLELRNRLKAVQTNGEATPKGVRSVKKKVVKSPPVASLFSISSNVVVETSNEEEEEKKRTERMQKSRTKRQIQSSTSSTKKKEKLEQEEEETKTTAARSTKREKLDEEESKTTPEVQESELKQKGGRRKKVETKEENPEVTETRSKQKEDEQPKADLKEENKSEKDVVQEEKPKKTVRRKKEVATQEEDATPLQPLESVNVEETKPKKVVRRKKTEVVSNEVAPASLELEKADDVEETKPKKTVRRKKEVINKEEEAVQSMEPEEEKPKRSQRKKEETEKMIALKASKLLKPSKTTKKKTVNEKQSEDINLNQPENSTVTPIRRRKTGPRSKTPQLIYNPDSVPKKTSEDSVSKPLVEDSTETPVQDQPKSINQGEKPSIEERVETVVKPVLENLIETVASTTEEQTPMEVVVETMKEVPQETTKEVPKETMKAVPQETTKDAPQETTKDVPKETTWMKSEAMEVENSLRIPPGIQFPTLVRPIFETVIVQPDTSSDNMEVEVSEKGLSVVNESNNSVETPKVETHVVVEFIQETQTKTVVVEMKQEEVIIIDAEVEEKQDIDEHKKEENEASVQISTERKSMEPQNDSLVQKEEVVKTTRPSEPGSSYFQSSIADSEFSYVTALEGEDSKKESFASVKNVEPSKEQEELNLSLSMEKQPQPAEVHTPQQQEEIVIQTPAKDDAKNDEEELFNRLETALLEATVGGITEADFEVYDAILSSFVQEKPPNHRAVHFEQSPSLNGSFLNVPSTPAVGPSTTSALTGGWLSAAPTPIRPPSNMLNWQFSQKIPSRRPPVPLFSPQLTQEPRQFSSPTVTAPRSAVKSKQLLQLQEFLREEERIVDKHPKFASSSPATTTTTTTQPKSVASIPRPQFIFSPPSHIAGNKAALLNVRKEIANSNNVSKNYSFDG